MAVFTAIHPDIFYAARRVTANGLKPGSVLLHPILGVIILERSHGLNHWTYYVPGLPAPNRTTVHVDWLVKQCRLAFEAG